MEQVIAEFRAVIDMFVAEAAKEGVDLTRLELLTEVRAGMVDTIEDELTRRIGLTIVDFEIEQIQKTESPE